MSHFGGSSSDIIVDPADGKPNVSAHVMIYPLNPLESPSDPITALMDVDGKLLPGYVQPNSAGQLEFQTVDSYSKVYGQDPAGNVYRYDSEESRDNAATIIAAFPDVQQQASDAFDLATSADEGVRQSAEAQRRTGQLAGTGSVDARTGTPVDAIQFVTDTGAAMQCAVFEPVTQNWFVSHNTPGTVDPRESTVVNRFDVNGNYLDMMTVTDAGHGTFIAALARDDGGVDIWMPIHQYDASNTSVSANQYAVKYRASTVNVGSADVTLLITSPSPLSTQTYMDVEADRLVISTSGVGPGGTTYQLYSLEEFLASGSDAQPIGKPIGPVSGGTLQGICVAGDTLYRWTGTDNSGGAGDPKMLYAYSFWTGELLYSRDFTDILIAGEPESLTVIRPNGPAVLMMGVSVGGAGARVGHYFRLTSGVQAEIENLSAPQTATGGLAAITPSAAVTIQQASFYQFGPFVFVFIQFTVTAAITFPASGSGDIPNVTVGTINAAPFNAVRAGGPYGLSTAGGSVGAVQVNSDKTISLGAVATAGNATGFDPGKQFTSSGTYLIDYSG